MNFKAFQKQYQGRKFGELVLHHRKELDLQTTIAALQGVTEELPLNARPLVESWIDDMNSSTRSEQFWRQDCGEAFSSITMAAAAKLRSAGLEPTTDDLFNMFQIGVLNFVYSTHQSPQSKAFIQKALWGWHPRQALSLLMQPTTALAITALYAVWGTFAGHPYLWVPYTGVAASIVTIPTRPWIASPRIGSLAGVSEIFKFVLAVVGLYALLAQLACIALITRLLVLR